MMGKDIAQKIFTHAEKNSKEDESEIEKQFFGKFVTIDNTVAMSAIKWENIGLSKCNRMTRSAIIWAIAIGIVAFAFYWMVRF